LWHVDKHGDNHEFIVDLCDHQSSVNAIRFSPCGKLLASVSDRQIVIYTGNCLFENDFKFIIDKN
jgi:uncharacterized protein with WD repeat